GARARVVTGPESRSAIRTINSARGAINSGVRVVPGSVPIGSKVRIIDWVITAVPIVGWVVPTSAPHGATPANHQSGVAGVRCISHPIIVAAFLLDGHIRDAVSRRVGWNLINLRRDCVGY